MADASSARAARAAASSAAAEAARPAASAAFILRSAAVGGAAGGDASAAAAAAGDDRDSPCSSSRLMSATPALSRGEGPRRSPSLSVAPPPSSASTTPTRSVAASSAAAAAANAAPFGANGDGTARIAAAATAARVDIEASAEASAHNSRRRDARMCAASTSTRSGYAAPGVTGGGEDAAGSSGSRGDANGELDLTGSRRARGAERSSSLEPALDAGSPRSLPYVFSFLTRGGSPSPAAASHPSNAETEAARPSPRLSAASSCAEPTLCAARRRSRTNASPACADSPRAHTSCFACSIFCRGFASLLRRDRRVPKIENESPRCFPDPEGRGFRFSGDRPAASSPGSSASRSSSESSPRRRSPAAPPAAGEPAADPGWEKTPGASASTEFRRKGGERRGDGDRSRAESARCSGDREPRREAGDSCRTRLFLRSSRSRLRASRANPRPSRVTGEPATPRGSAGPREPPGAPWVPAGSAFAVGGSMGGTRARGYAGARGAKPTISPESASACAAGPAAEAAEVNPLSAAANDALGDGDAASDSPLDCTVRNVTETTRRFGCPASARADRRRAFPARTIAPVRRYSGSAAAATDVPKKPPPRTFRSFPRARPACPSARRSSLSSSRSASNSAPSWGEGDVHGGRAAASPPRSAASSATPPKSVARLRFSFSSRRFAARICDPACASNAADAATRRTNGAASRVPRSFEATCAR